MPYIIAGLMLAGFLVIYFGVEYYHLTGLLRGIRLGIRISDGKPSRPRSVPAPVRAEPVELLNDKLEVLIPPNLSGDVGSGRAATNKTNRRAASYERQSRPTPARRADAKLSKIQRR